MVYKFNPFTANLDYSLKDSKVFTLFPTPPIYQDWNLNVQYLPDDIVNYAGFGWKALIDPSLGVPPVEGSEWTNIGLDGSTAGATKDNPYIFGSNKENVLLVDKTNLPNGESFIIINETSLTNSKLEYRIGGNCKKYVGLRNINWGGGQYAVGPFNNEDGFLIQNDKFCIFYGDTIAGVPTWFTPQQNQVSGAVISWEAGVDIDSEGYEHRNSLNGIQYKQINTLTFPYFTVYNPIDADGEVAGFNLGTASGWNIFFRSRQGYGWFEMADGSGDAMRRWFQNDDLMTSNGIFGWSSEANRLTDHANDSRDLGLTRMSAGRLEINNGTSGTFADLRLRYLQAENFTNQTGNAITTGPGLSLRIFDDGTNSHIQTNDDSDRDLIIQTGFNKEVNLDGNFYVNHKAFFNGSFARNTSTISVDTILDGTNYRVIANTGLIVTLPSAVGVQGREYNIIRSGTGNVTITPDGSETISGDSNLILTSQWDSVVIVSDGTNWVRCS